MKLVVAFAVLAAARSVDASCAFVELGPTVLTPRDAQIPADGGIVVGFTAKLPDAPAKDAGADPSVSSAFAFGKVAAVRESLAPGLSVYRPKTRAGKLDFTAGAKPVGSFAAAAAAPAPLPAPAVASLQIAESFRGTPTVTATLSADAPAGAIALVAYGPYGPLAFGQPSPGTRTITVLQGGHCSFPPGNAPGKSDKVTFAWVDASGHLSPRSAAVTPR